MGKDTGVRIRVCPVSLFSDVDVQNSSIQRISVGDFSHFLQPGDGILVYIANEDHSECTIIALCEVISSDLENESILIDLRLTSGTVRPDSAQRWRWAKSPYLCLDRKKVKKYELLELFAAEFNTENWDYKALQDCVQGKIKPNISKPTLILTEGTVYLFRSSTLYKIGKTTQLEKRKKQIEKDIGEKIELIHQMTSNDIDRAEITLHQKYSKLRRWGEWFDLQPEHVTEIYNMKRMEF